MNNKGTPDDETAVKDHQQRLRESVWETYSTDLLLAQEQEILLPVKLNPLDRSIRQEEQMATSSSSGVSPPLPRSVLELLVGATEMKVNKMKTGKILDQNENETNEGGLETPTEVNALHQVIPFEVRGAEQYFDSSKDQNLFGHYIQKDFVPAERYLTARTTARGSYSYPVRPTTGTDYSFISPKYSNTNLTQGLDPTDSSSSCQIPFRVPSYFNDTTSQNIDNTQRNGVTTSQPEFGTRPTIDFSQQSHCNNLNIMNTQNYNGYNDVGNSSTAIVPGYPQYQPNMSIAPYQFQDQPRQGDPVHPGGQQMAGSDLTITPSNFAPQFNLPGHSPFQAEHIQVPQQPTSGCHMYQEQLPYYNNQQPPPPYHQSTVQIIPPRKRAKIQKLQSAHECPDVVPQTMMDPGMMFQTPAMMGEAAGNHGGKNAGRGKKYQNVKLVPTRRRRTKIFEERNAAKCQLEEWLCYEKNCDERTCSIVKQNLNHLQYCISMNTASCKDCLLICKEVFHSEICQDLNCPIIYCSIVARKSVEELFSDPGFVYEFLKSLGVDYEEMKEVHVLKTLL